MSDHEWSQRIVFSLGNAAFKKLAALAAHHGYHSASAFARAKMEELAGAENEKPLSHDSMLFSLREGWILKAIVDKPKTLREVAFETGKHYSSLQPTIKMLLARSWVVAVEEKFTGGRPATLYALTEAGRLRLDQEAERIRLVTERNAEALKHQMRAGARANPDRVKTIVIKDPTTPMGTYAKLLLDRLYAEVNPTLSEKEIEAELTAAIELRLNLVAEGLATWEQEIAFLKTPEGGAGVTP